MKKSLICLGIMLPGQILRVKSANRLTNNPVECWFSHLKHSILNKRIVATSEHVSSMYEFLSAKFENYYNSQDKTIRKKTLKRKFCSIFNDKNLNKIICLTFFIKKNYKRKSQ